jgi:hypothetical protein
MLPLRFVDRFVEALPEILEELVEPNLKVVVLMNVDGIHPDFEEKMVETYSLQDARVTW